MYPALSMCTSTGRLNDEPSRSHQRPRPRFMESPSALERASSLSGEHTAWTRAGLSDPDVVDLRLAPRLGEALRVPIDQRPRPGGTH
jgi:hypothetical protein